MTDAHPLSNDIRPLARRIGKPPADWQRADLLRVCLEDGIRVLNLHCPALDGKLKELRLPVNSAAYLERILAAGERVDGSSLFPGLLDSTSSDLYAGPLAFRPRRPALPAGGAARLRSGRGNRERDKAHVREQVLQEATGL